MADQHAEAATSDDAAAQARGRALSSPLRLRILRLCRFDARTNKELATLLGISPGTMLHHVRTLVQCGFLAAQPVRSGRQGAREVPYLATGLSWRTPVPGGGAVLVETFLQQIDGLAPDDLRVTWLGLKLNDAHLHELEERLFAVIDDFRRLGPDADGEPYSLFSVVHPDLNPPPRDVSA